MKLVVLTTLLIIGLVLVLPAILTVGIKFIPENIQPSLDKSQRIYNQGEITQPFKAQEDRLAAIGVSLRNPSLANKKDITLELSQLDGTVIRQVRHNGRFIADGKFVRFAFPPIAQSKNQQYQFHLLAPTAKRDEALEVFLTNDSQYAGAQIIEEGKLKVLLEATPAAAFVVFHQPESILVLIGSIYSDWWNRLWSDLSFATAYFVLLAAGVVYLATPLAVKKLRKSTKS